MDCRGWLERAALEERLVVSMLQFCSDWSVEEDWVILSLKKRDAKYWIGLVVD